MSYPVADDPHMNEDLAIACVLYVAEQEKISPVDVLWGIVPLANRQTLDDGITNEKATSRQGGGSYTEDNSFSRRAC